MALDIDPIAGQTVRGATFRTTSGLSIVSAASNFDQNTWAHELVHHISGKWHSPDNSGGLQSYDSIRNFTRDEAIKIYDALKKIRN